MRLLLLIALLIVVGMSLLAQQPSSHGLLSIFDPICVVLKVECSATNVFTAAAAMVGGLWVLYAFAHARRVKTGELLAQLENGVNTTLSTLLQIESRRSYADTFALPLLKSLIQTDGNVVAGSLNCSFDENAYFG
ncbi:hypothetical protein [Gemmatimonas sp.]|uniref:hypothetical protein n=1 Tax=Gemmatimonas sp. TaxID=1962908 RepID=UPI003F6E8B0D